MNHSTRHEITLECELKGLSGKQLIDELETELNERAHELKLDEPYCKDAGSIGEVCIMNLAVESFRDEADDLGGTFIIDFEESYYSGCKDLSWSNKWSGTAQFCLNCTTGFMKFTLTAVSKLGEV
jgi:hypothetical protein